MKIISMKQLRKNFSPIRKGLNRGQSYLLMYRSKPLATLQPYTAETTNQEKIGIGNKDIQDKISTFKQPNYSPIAKALTAVNQNSTPTIKSSPELKKQAQFQLEKLKKILSP